MQCSLIYSNDGKILFAVDNETQRFKVGDFYLTPSAADDVAPVVQQSIQTVLDDWHAEKISNSWFVKVIGQYPLSDDAETVPGLPLLPPIPSEEERIFSKFHHLFRDYIDQPDKANLARHFFLLGYYANTKKWVDSDIFNFVEYFKNAITYSIPDALAEYISHLDQKTVKNKKPKGFEPILQAYSADGLLIDYAIDNTDWVGVRAKKLANGTEVLYGNWIFND